MDRDLSYGHHQPGDDQEHIYMMPSDPRRSTFRDIQRARDSTFVPTPRQNHSVPEHILNYWLWLASISSLCENIQLNSRMIYRIVHTKRRQTLFFLVKSSILSSHSTSNIWHFDIVLPRASEQSIIGARASVMVYDDNQKKWIPSGTSSGLSKVHIYHHQQNNTFRVVGRKLQDHEVVINCSILKGLKYNQATPTFHQWRDSKFVYGLNFSSQQDAEAFARAMLHALEVCTLVHILLAFSTHSALLARFFPNSRANKYKNKTFIDWALVHAGLERSRNTAEHAAAAKRHPRLWRGYGLSNDDQRRGSYDTADHHTEHRSSANSATANSY